MRGPYRSLLIYKVNPDSGSLLLASQTSKPDIQLQKDEATLPSALPRSPTLARVNLKLQDRPRLLSSPSLLALLLFPFLYFSTSQSCLSRYALTH